LRSADEVFVEDFVAQDVSETVRGVAVAESARKGRRRRGGSMMGLELVRCPRRVFWTEKRKICRGTGEEEGEGVVHRSSAVIEHGRGRGARSACLSSACIRCRTTRTISSVELLG
jgi:hypothetical protein